MTDTLSALPEAPQLPFARADVLHISPLYDALRRERGPVAAVTTSVGDPAWLVTGYEEARTAFADRRFGYFTHHDPEHAPRAQASIVHGKPFGGPVVEEEMLRLRRLLTPAFTPKRMKLLLDWIQELIDGCLDDMQAAHDAAPDQPVDFHEHVGWRLPVLVIGALLGVPDADRDHTIELSDRMGGMTDEQDAVAAMMELEEYMRGLIEVKRANPGEDVISDMVAAFDADPEFFHERTIERYAAGMVFPGHETTVARMDFGLLYLLDDPRWKPWLMEDPENRIDAAVEEIARLTSAHNLGLLRWAVEDVEFAGVRVQRGDLVIISESAADRDPAMWDDPDTFDPTRAHVPNVSFGHGGHVCLGQSLARTELKLVFPSLLRRFPDIRLAGDVRELSIRGDRTGGGVERVEVTW